MSDRERRAGQARSADPGAGGAGASESTTALVRTLALVLRDAVRPLLGAHGGREHGDTGAGGDITFAVDGVAEDTLARFMTERAPALAFYSEDRGLVVPAGGAAEVLVVDPIDGTRPAMAGLESCCVSVAAAPLRDGVTMGEVTSACVVEIPSGARFVARRGEGLVESPPVRLSVNERLDRMFWTYGFRGRPARPTVEVIGDLIDASSVRGATFDLGSAAFDMTRILTGQLDCYVEPGPRLIADVPAVEADFRRVGDGAILNNSPYDLAGAALCLTEGGAIVTDAYGSPLDDRPLLGSGVDYQMSIVASANERLHERVLAAIDAGVARLRSKY